MPIDRSDPHRHPRVAALALAVVLPLTGCSGDDSWNSSERHGRQKTSAAPLERDYPALGRGRDVAGSIESLLDRRARAVLAGRWDDYADSVAGPAASRQEQSTSWDNLAQLPVSAYSLDLDAGSLVRDGDTWWGTVEARLRLQGYDVQPVASRERYRFERDGGRWVVSSTTDRAWESDNPGAPQPWDLEPVTVREQGGVLGVFDSGSVSRADEVMAAVSDGIAQVAPRIPMRWNQRVVVYALASTAFLDRLAGVPGGDPRAVDGVTFPVMADPASSEIASTRFVLNPRLLDVDAEARDRLIRHELVHVALGSRDDAIPVWLSEGLAEFLSVRSLPPSERVVSGDALEAARAGLTALPDTETFNGPDSLANYGVAWWVCEAIAETWGEQMLWTLVEELDGADDPDARLQELLGTTTRQLVRDAGELMLSTYE